MQRAWTSAEWELAKQLVTEGGLTGSQVALRLGRTRSGVLGKMHREGVEGRKQTIWTKERTRIVSLAMRAGKTNAEIKPLITDIEVSVDAVRGKVERLKADRLRRNAAARDYRGRKRRGDRESQDVERSKRLLLRRAAKAPTGPGVTLLELRDGPWQCRYPLGDVMAKATHFCGEPVEPDRAYCSAHCAICLSPYLAVA